MRKAPEDHSRERSREVNMDSFSAFRNGLWWRIGSTWFDAHPLLTGLSQSGDDSQALRRKGASHA